MRKNSKGQVLLIVVLVIVVGLIVALSVVTRSVTNLRVSTEEENSQRAFSAAEAGVEQMLKTAQSGVSPLSPIGGSFGIATYNTSPNPINGNQFLINDGKPVAKDDGADVWLSDYPTFATPTNPFHFIIAWGKPSDTTSPCTAAAIEVIVVSAPVLSPQVTRYAFDPCSRGNHFNTNLQSGSITIPTVSGQTFPFYTHSRGANSIRVDNNALLLRVIPLYFSTPIAISACNAGGGACQPLPDQGTRIESTGTSGGTSRKIAVFRGFPKLPSEFFQYALFSP